ncbi:glutathione S-transferase family protein [Onishia niordana]|uniref:glutathione S-transferase family protein n=1 Tax=Onishia niordana TaxID=2508711 RepID=UPI0010A0235B|nr:glutathione S-transferase [Halomonas niordiana]
MIEVHHLENSRSQRVIWLLEELSVDYKVITYRRDPKTMLAPASLKQVHPLGKSPVIVDTESDDVVAESGAIIEYLLERFDDGQLLPAAGTEERRRYRFWLHHAEGSAMPPLVMSLVFSRLDKPPVPALIRPIARLLASGVKSKFLDPQIQDLLSFWENACGEHAWLAGEAFSGADIQMSFPLLALEGQGRLADHPRLTDLLARMRNRPAYQRAVEQGGEFSMAE